MTNKLMKVSDKEKTIYVSVDGVKFTNEDECVQYEKSLKHVYECRFDNMIVETFTELDFFGFGYESDQEFVLIKISSEDDKSTIKGLMEFQSSDEETLQSVDRMKVGELYAVNYLAGFLGVIKSKQDILDDFYKQMDEVFNVSNGENE